MPVYYDHALGGIVSQVGTVKQWQPVDDGIDGDLTFYSTVTKEIVKTFGQIAANEIEIAFRLFAAQAARNAPAARNIGCFM